MFSPDLPAFHMAFCSQAYQDSPGEKDLFDSLVLKACSGYVHCVAHPLVGRSCVQYYCTTKKSRLFDLLVKVVSWRNKG